MDMKGLRGIAPIVNTPFDEELAVDFRSLERLVERAISEGVSALIVPAVASEVAKLTASERQDVVRCVTSSAAGRVPVIAGAGVAAGAEGAELLKAYADMGCPNVLVQIPEGVGQDRGDATRHFSELPLSAFEGVMIQDLDWTGSGARIEVIAALRDTIPNFRYLKVETVMAGLKYTAVREALGESVSLAGGWAMPQMIEALDRGVALFTTTAINYPFVVVYRLFAEGRRDVAVEVFERSVPVLAWSHQHIDVSIAFLKRYCVRVGLFVTARVREPTARYDKFHLRFGDELIERVIALELALNTEFGGEV